MTAPESARRRPLVTIVTPSLNQGRFLRAAIDSVLEQDYPRIEYLVFDGGSCDESLDILASYGDRLKWVCEADDGQSHAINKGFRQARGSILGWLNSDDIYAPGAITKVVETFASLPEVGLVYGNGSILDETGDVVGDFDEIEPFSLWRLVHCLDYILQPAAFFRRDAALEVGLLDERLEFAMDWDLWIRLAAHSDVFYLDENLGSSRVYSKTKTSTGGWRRIRELRRLASKHSGRFATPGVRLYALDTLSEQLVAHSWSGFRRAVRYTQGRMMRRATERLPCHADGWLGPRGKLLVPRRWRQAEVVLEAHKVPSDKGIAVEITAESVRLARIVAERPGQVRVRLDLPSGSQPFVELEVSSDFSFRALPDRRRLSVCCFEVRRCETEPEAK